MLDLLRQLPIRQLDRLRFWVRNRFATKAWPTSHDHVRTPTSVSQAEALLRDAHFEGAEEWSLKYEGEVLNLRRPASVDVDGLERELHLRARRDHENMTLTWNGHVEANRFEAMHAHVHEEGLTWMDAQALAALLTEAGLPTDT